MQIKVRKAIISKRRHSFAGDAVSPEIFTEPIPKLRAVAMNVFTHTNADPADGRATDVDAKAGGWLGVHGAL